MDIISLPIDSGAMSKLSRYQVVILASQRARQIIEGSEKPTHPSRHVKPTTLALEEIVKGDLEILYGKEAIRYQQEARRHREERKNRLLSPEREEELRQEIKKDLSVYLEDAKKSSVEVKEAPEETA